MRQAWLEAEVQFYTVYYGINSTLYCRYSIGGKNIWREGLEYRVQELGLFLQLYRKKAYK